MRSAHALTLRYGALARAIAGRSLQIAAAEAGQRTHTDGETIFLSTRTDADAHVEITVQCALLAAGSLAPHYLLPLVGRRERAQRYLTLEAARILKHCASLPRLIVQQRLALAPPLTTSAAESVRRSADRRLHLIDEPLLGTLHPARVLAQTSMPRGQARPDDLQRAPSSSGSAAPEIDDAEDADELPSVIKKLSSPLNLPNPFARFFHQAIGSRRAAGADTPGMEIPTTSVRRSRVAPRNGARAHYQIEMDESASVPRLVSRWTYPEWDCVRGTYRPDWCTVHEVPFTLIEDRAQTRRLRHDPVLQEALRRLALGMIRLRRQLEGDDIDVDAVTDLTVDRVAALRRGAADEQRAALYTATQRMRRDLSALLLIDVSGSVAARGLRAKAVLDEQLYMGAAITMAFTRAGDRSAAMAFHSRGRDEARVIALKSFDEPHAGAALTRILSLSPSGYTRLGVGLRHGLRRVIEESCTERRLLIVLSDGVPYDLDYSGRYACEDVIRSLAEAEREGVRVLWICFGEMAPALQAALESGPHELVTGLEGAALSRAVARALALSVLRTSQRNRTFRAPAAATVQ